MALCILGGYWDARLRGEDLLEATLRRFQEWRAARPPDVGTTTLDALLASRQHGLAGGFVSWEQSGYSAAGNGALMRAAASVVAGSRGDTLRREAVDLAMLTHPDPRSLGACWALVVDAGRAARRGRAGRRLARRPGEVDKAKLDRPIQDRFGAHRGALVRERLPEARAADP